MNHTESNRYSYNTINTLQLTLPAEISLDHFPRSLNDFDILNRRWHFYFLVKVAFACIFYHLLQHSA
jgi:ABC-type uncharacterized transport system permease subunit